MKQRKRVKRWMKLDNSAMIYPAIRNARFSTMFRVSVTLTEEVDPKVLQTALEDTVKRIPFFGMRLRTGLFWRYLEQNDGTPQVEADVANPCKPIGKGENGGFLFRVRVDGCRIALEPFHVLTDGNGAMVFLKTLAARYLTLMGKQIPFTDGVLDTSARPKKGELEDAFSKYAAFRKRAPRRESKAYHFKGTLEPFPTLHIISATIPLGPLLEKARAAKATLTEFLAANYILALHRLQTAERHLREKDVKLCVPVNLRKFFPSDTLRNFVLYLTPGIDPSYGDYTLEEIVEQVHCQMRMRLNRKYIAAQICTNVSDERNPFIRMVPLLFKDWAMSMAFRVVGESCFSATLSNLGETKVPDEMRPYVKRFDFLLGASKINRGNLTAVSYGGSLGLNFTRTTKETFIEREFFTQLVKLGIPVKIESNDQ